ncbi:MAG TPA: hypothetical protein VGF69_05055 [Thermoanaerobaculia bacterium]|jgi:hypothetical protein
MTTMTVSIYGISCLLDPRMADSFEKRVLLPTDNQEDATHPAHVAYVEFCEVDLVTAPEDIPRISGPYVRDGIRYRRLELNGHRVSLSPLDNAAPFEVSPTFDIRVPKMTKVNPELDAHPADSCFLPDPPTSLVRGYFDITQGRLMAGAIDRNETSFNPLEEWPPTRLAINALLEITTTGTDGPTVTVEDLVNGGITTIVLQSNTANINIGNLPPSDFVDINAFNPSTDDISRDFLIFYGLAKTPPAVRPVPTTPIGLETACTPVNWP